MYSSQKFFNLLIKGNNLKFTQMFAYLTCTDPIFLYYSKWKLQRTIKIVKKGEFKCTF